MGTDTLLTRRVAISSFAAGVCGLAVVTACLFAYVDEQPLGYCLVTSFFVHAMVGMAGFAAHRALPTLSTARAIIAALFVLPVCFTVAASSFMLANYLWPSLHL